MEFPGEHLLPLAYALGVGLLIGLERSLGQSLNPDPRNSRPGLFEGEEESRDSGEFIGLRTFTMLSLTGYTAGLLSPPWAGAVVVAGVCLLVVVMYHHTVSIGPGITTEVAAIGTCLLGLLCHSHPQLAGVLAVLVTALLTSKGLAQRTIRKMRRVELTDTLKFLVMILIILPLLPDRTVDPWQVINPWQVGFLVTLVSGISFVGYFLDRILGPRKGLGLTGLVAGLSSSTALTASMAALARSRPGLNQIYVFAILTANAVTFLRVLLVVLIINPALAALLARSLGTMAVVATLCAAVFWKQAGRIDEKNGTAENTMPNNPFSMGPALKFAAFFMVILFVARFSNEYYGIRGLYGAAAFSGLADVDAMTLSLAKDAGGSFLPLPVAATGITIAVVSNNLTKAVLSLVNGGMACGLRVSVCLTLATLTGLFTLLFP